MKIQLTSGILLATAAMGLVACERKDADSAPTSTTSTPASRTTASPTSTTSGTESPSATNSARNKQDQDNNTKTPMDQSQAQSDIKITAEIRRAIMDDKAMTMNGQNCKIITESGVVTLRGPVDSQAEKDSIEAKAKAVAGVTSVTNELEVKTN